MFKVFVGLIATLLVCNVVIPVSAQESGLQPIIIEATRVEKDSLEIPAAVSTIGQDEIQLGTQQLGIDESLGSVPGLFFLNRYNFAQDLRASIRGFGARSSFGIRGIKIIVDGIPETLPDGQGSVDGIDIGSASLINVIRGPASSLYGNAAGGAILIETESGPVRPFVEAGSILGAYDYEKFHLKTGGENGNLNYLMNISDTSIDGYRDHSEFENTQFNGRFEYTLSNTSSLLTSIHHTDQPVANDAGGINAADVAADRRQARAQNLLYDAGEALRQTRVGLLYKTQLSARNSLEARVYNTTRDFSNRLPFEAGGTVTIDRRFMGGGLKYTTSGEFVGRPNRLLVGLDFDRQDDDRSRFDNLSGVRGDRSFEQNELVTSVGVFLQNETRIMDSTELTVGLRSDKIEFDVSDRFLTDGDDSGKVSLDQVSPMIGLSFKQNEHTHLYTTLSYAFETPTTTEFANPAGGGFNQSLEAQKSTNYEIGLKTLTDSYRFETAIFHIDVEDELVPFELATQPGRTFYENAGKSDRDGLEISYTRYLAEVINFTLAYTYSNFVFDSFRSDDGDIFDGKKIPGIPDDLLYLSFSWAGENGIHASWDSTYSGALFADNANQDKVGSNTVSNAIVGYNWFSRQWELTSFLRINNLFDEKYNSNIRINAFGSRYFEPAPERNTSIGVTLRRRFAG